MFLFLEHCQTGLHSPQGYSREWWSQSIHCEVWGCGAHHLGHENTRQTSSGGWAGLWGLGHCCPEESAKLCGHSVKWRGWCYCADDADPCWCHWCSGGCWLLMPPGAMSLKIQVIFLFFFSLSRICKLIGFSVSRDVFFCGEQIQQRDAGNALWQNSSKSI